MITILAFDLKQFHNFNSFFLQRLYKNVPYVENFTDFLYDALLNSYLQYSITQSLAS
jgi:hypothetical protein